MPLVIPDDTHNLAIISPQKSAFRLHTEVLFDLFDARVRAARFHADLAEATGDLIQDLLTAYAPFLKGAKQNSKNPHDSQSGKGFKKRLSTDLRTIIKGKKWPLATVSNDATSYYCPTLRRWVREPEDCPDLIE